MSTLHDQRQGLDYWKSRDVLYCILGVPRYTFEHNEVSIYAFLWSRGTRSSLPYVLLGES